MWAIHCSPRCSSQLSLQSFIGLECRGTCGGLCRGRRPQRRAPRCAGMALCRVRCRPSTPSRIALLHRTSSSWAPWNRCDTNDDLSSNVICCEPKLCMFVCSYFRRVDALLCLRGRRLQSQAIGGPWPASVLLSIPKRMRWDWCSTFTRLSGPNMPFLPCLGAKAPQIEVRLWREAVDCLVMETSPS